MPCDLYIVDEDELDFWMHRQRKIWNDMKIRQIPASREDLLGRAKGQGSS
ncbi:MAG: hypothetical protein JW986_11305 [Methanotrichaceae archaeon]|nr:hypothetical protein [Methanotrichaceae archaeon]